MSTFNEMKKYRAKHPECNLCYDSPYSDYIAGLYGDAESVLAETYQDLYIEPSVQCGRGGVFASFVCDGTYYRTNWDFESECETLAE